MKLSSSLSPVVEQGLGEASPRLAVATHNSSTTSRWQTLPHEWAFGGMLLLLFIRLAWQAGHTGDYALLFLGYFLFGVSLSWWCSRNPTPLRWRVRLAAYFTLMGLVFYTLPAAVRLLQVPTADSLLQSIDGQLLNLPAADYFKSLQSPLLTDVMVLAYLFFFYYLLFGPGYYCFSDLHRFRLCITGLFSIYAVGLLSYSVMPAGGPHLALHFAAPLPAGPVGRLMLPVIDSSSNGVDVFPSIHAAVSAYLLGFDALYYRRRFRLLLLPCVLLWLSTIYLRYHYLIDLAAGFTLALAGLGVVWLYQRSRLAQAVEIEADRAIAPQAAAGRRRPPQAAAGRRRLKPRRRPPAAAGATPQAESGASTP